MGSYIETAEDGTRTLIEKRDDGSVIHEIPLAPARPRLRITNITADKDTAVINEDFTEVTCVEGTTLTATAVLEDHVGEILPITDTFRLPIEGVDGRLFLKVASFTAGTSVTDVLFKESNIWQITERQINSALPPQAQMDFAGLKIYVGS